MKKYILLYLLAIIWSTEVKGQQNPEPQKAPNDTSRIAATARTSPDSITLRWLADEFHVLKKGATSGYKISRAEFVGNGWSRFTPVATVKAWDKARWEAHFNGIKDTSSNAYKYGRTAYEILIEKNTSVFTDLKDMKAIMAAKSQQELMFMFAILASCNDRYAAEGLGLRWVDKDVVAGTRYKYKVELADYKGVLPIIPSEFETKAEPYFLKVKAKITPIENEGQIGLTWEMSEEPIFSYSLERSEDNGRTFRRLNSEPIMIEDTEDKTGKSMGNLQDTTVELYKPYVYRVIGHTLFADEVRVGEVKAMSRDRTPVSAIFVASPEYIAKKKAKIKWQVLSDAKDLVGFKVRRDSIHNGQFTKVLNKTPLLARATEFIDETFNPEINNFYVIETVDTAGNIFKSQPVLLFVPDTIPPAAPRWVNAVVDTNGIVTLRFKPNKEKDFMGYRIYRANQANHEYSAIKETFARKDSNIVMVKDSIFYDTISLNTLSREVFYKAIALDLHFNQSLESTPVRLVRPDKIPPVAPLIKSVDVTDTTVTLSIIPSSSTDVKTMKVLRRFGRNKDWIPYSTLVPNATSFTDKKVETQVTYEYALQVMDSSNLISPLSHVMRARPYETGVREGIEKLDVTYDKKEQEATLTWVYNPKKTKEGEKIHFLIYRSWANQGLERYFSVPNDGQFIFKDKDFAQKGKYNYSIKVVTDSGAESELSIKTVAIIE